MPERDPARRAVVTGLGAIMPIGNDFPTYWANLQAAVTGTRTIRSFDASQHEVRIAAEVLDFDPTTVMEPKMARRMSRFIHLAMGAGKEAVADSGIDFAAMSQEQRDRIMGRFREGALDVLVATDVAARGLDVDDITHVINFDPPQGDNDYVHRVGRTGRAGRSGTGVTFVLPDQRGDVSRLATRLGHGDSFASSGMAVATRPKPHNAGGRQRRRSR